MKFPVVFFRAPSVDILQLENANLAYSDASYVEAFKAKGIFTLRRLSGGTRSDISAASLALNFISSGSDFIIIDEYISFKFRRMKVLREAIKLAKEVRPGLKIALWNSFWITPEAIKTYQKYVDLILIETYTFFKMRPLLWLLFKTNWKTLQANNLLTKSLFVLGINDSPAGRYKALRGGDLLAFTPWANSEKRLKAQISYIKKRCPGTQGIGFFVKDAKLSLLKVADRLAGMI